MEFYFLLNIVFFFFSLISFQDGFIEIDECYLIENRVYLFRVCFRKGVSYYCWCLVDFKVGRGIEKFYFGKKG